MPPSDPRATTNCSCSLVQLSVTFSSGFLLGHLLPARCLVHPDQRLVFSLFVAIAMAITAVPVIAKAPCPVAVVSSR